MNSTLTRILSDSFERFPSPKYSIPHFPVVTLGCSVPRGATNYIVPVALLDTAPCFKPSPDLEIGTEEETHYIRAFSLRAPRADPSTAPKTVSLLMKRLHSSSDGELTKVTTSRGYTYYGDRGVIFNDRLEPLLLTAHWLRNMGTAGERSTPRVWKLLLVDGHVPTNKDTLSKAIIKDFIPCYRNYAVDILFTDLRRYVIQSPMVNQKFIQNGVTVLSDIISHNL